MVPYLTIGNRLETLACSISTGAIGIWCMHFIGNRAIILGDGTPSIQLVYSPGYTTLSVFLPIIGLTVAFSAAEYPSRSPALHWIALTCTGVFAGLSIVGMHYVANFGVSNYKLEYVPRFLAASITIAIGDCLAVLVLFYTWREKWISDWWKRLLCAVTLAGGVSAMHFTASTNCIYRFKDYNAPAAIHSRNIQVIVAGILCGTAAVIVLCVLFITRHRARVMRKRSQKVMLACAMFDPDGRILVTTEGVLPAREITDRYNHRTFDDEFDTAHLVFQWIFRVSRNWSGVSELIPKMKSHLNGHRGDEQNSPRPSSSASSTIYDPETYSDYSIIFRERFCAAAASLAASMHLPVEKVGVLYDNIIETGTLTPEERTGRCITLTTDKELRDVEMGSLVNLFGKGQLLFLTRQLDVEDTDKLLNAGFRFASIQHVGRSIAEAMQVPLPNLEVHVSSLRRYVDDLQSLKKPGAWLSFFALIPKANSKGFDIAVKRDNRDQLPDIQLLPIELVQWQADFLKRMDDKTPANCFAFLEDRTGQDVGRSAHECQFAIILIQALIQLGQQVPVQWLHHAKFYARPLQAHYSQGLRSRAPVTTLYSFIVCADLHTSLEGNGGIIRVPLSFFSARQQCYAGSPNKLVLDRDIHQEFGPLLAPKATKTASHKVKKISIHIPSGSRKKLNKGRSRHASNHTSSDDHTDSSSDTHDLVDKPRLYSNISQDEITEADRTHNWGGILVNSETVIKSDSKSEFSSDSHPAGLGVGIRTAVGTSRPEKTFVDELVAATRAAMPSKITY